MAQSRSQTMRALTVSPVYIVLGHANGSTATESRQEVAWAVEVGRGRRATEDPEGIWGGKGWVHWLDCGHGFTGACEHVKPYQTEHFQRVQMCVNKDPF